VDWGDWWTIGIDAGWGAALGVLFAGILGGRRGSLALTAGLAAAFAWVLVGEALAALQVGGMVLVVAAVVWVQSHRPDLEAEVAPPSLRAAR
jgi:drug/metabolite transporter (DMT)-like permease